MRGNFQLLDSNYHWDVNFADSANKASQKFVGGYNLGNIQLALGDPAIGLGGSPGREFPER